MCCCADCRDLTTAGLETDISSLGAILVYAATGRSPFGEGSTQALSYREVDAGLKMTGVPESLYAMVTAMLDEDPTQRPTPQQIIDDLDTHAPTTAYGSWLPTSHTADIMNRCQ